MSFIEMYADGASRSNPGPAGIGVVIYKNGEELFTISEYIGKKTNNEAITDPDNTIKIFKSYNI